MPASPHSVRAHCLAPDANRDLERGHAVGLPSGEAVARHLGVTVLSAAQVGLADILAPSD
jgi:hypothetical protein